MLEPVAAQCDPGEAFGIKGDNAVTLAEVIASSNKHIGAMAPEPQESLLRIARDDTAHLESECGIHGKRRAARDAVCLVEPQTVRIEDHPVTGDGDHRAA